MQRVRNLGKKLGFFLEVFRACSLRHRKFRKEALKMDQAAEKFVSLQNMTTFTLTQCIFDPIQNCYGSRELKLLQDNNVLKIEEAKVPQFNRSSVNGRLFLDTVTLHPNYGSKDEQV